METHMSFFKNTKVIAGFVALVVIAGVAITIFLKLPKTSNYQDLAKDINFIQENTAEVFAAQSSGDEFLATGKANIDSEIFINAVNNKAANVITNLATLDVSEKDTLYDYNLSLKEWATEISSVHDIKNWEATFEEPRPFTMSLTNAEAQEALKVSIEKIEILKEFGDVAIIQNDKETLRYISAKLMAQLYWLKGLEASTNQSLFNLSYSKTAYAAFLPHPKRTWPTVRRNVCYKGVCITDFVRSIEPASKFAWSAKTYSYKYGPASTKEWQDSWKDAKPLIESAGGQALPCFGCVSEGQKEEAKYSPSVQSFFDECSQKGGTTGGGVKERLPTTESGYSCNYPSGKSACWDLLTYSGGRYMGGNPGCPEQNLVPKVIIVAPTEEKPAVAPPKSNTETGCSDDIKAQLKEADALVKQAESVVQQSESVVNSCVPPKTGPNYCATLKAQWQTSRATLDTAKADYEKAKADYLKKCGQLPQ